MASVYVKGGKWWCKLKGVKIPGEWGGVPSDYKATEANREKALAFAVASQRIIDARAKIGSGGAVTVTQYGEHWLAEPTRQSLASIRDMTGHLRNHVFTRIGDMRMQDVRPRHIRDVIRALKSDTSLDLGPKTVLNIYGTTRTMFHDAVVDEVIAASPCVVARDELPAKIDKDPEWRELATYDRSEVVALLTSTKVPPERRIQYAMKALAGLRHGEVAGVRWRSRVKMEPLHRLSIARTYQDQRTKTKVTRLVPEHPALTRMLDAWARMWPDVYGRASTPDDFIVPTRTFKPVDPSDAVIAFKADLDALGLRVAAGEYRDRGGHDLRAWFISTAIEDGAREDALYTVTHTKKKDVASGYNRQRWTRLCDAVSALKFPLDGDPLPLGTDELPRQQALRRHYYKRGLTNENKATPTGFEPVTNTPNDHKTTGSTRNSTEPMTSCDFSRALLVASLGTGGGKDE